MDYEKSYIVVTHTFHVFCVICLQQQSECRNNRATTGYTVSEESSSTQQDENGDTVKNMEDYDVIFLGYPIWWSDMPMAVYTFLESYDFSGKTIIPFCTHEGSGLSSTDSSIAEICTGADVLDGLEMRGSVAQNSQDEALTAVTDWLDKIEILDEN